MVQVLSADTRVVEYMERSVLNKLLLRGRGLGFVSGDPRQNLIFGNLLRNRDASGNVGNHVGNSVTPSGDSCQHLVRCNAAVFREAIVAVDGHTNDELRLCELPEVDASQRIFMRQIHVDVRVNRRLSSTSQFILHAMAPRAVAAKQRIKSVLESLQRPLLVKTHLLSKNEGFYVRSATSVREY